MISRKPDRRSERLCLLVVLSIIFIAFSVHPLAEGILGLPEAEDLVPAVGEYVVDGDTAWFKVWEGGHEVSHSVRFIGIDTPEMGSQDKTAEPGALEARDYVMSKLDGQAVLREYDIERTDRYGRQLCYVWLLDGRMLNLDLVMRGYAKALTIKPNTKYTEFFEIAQQNAADRGTGLWESTGN